jgi:hypothetical protein
MVADIARNFWRLALCSVGLLVIAAATGCQVDIGGQMHPSPYYLTDDVQYFAPAQEFKLSKEAAALKQYAAEQQLQNPPR